MNTVLPTVSGTPKVFETLTSTNGTWVPATGLSFTRAWQRCNSAGGACAAISGATATSYLLERDDFGHTLRIRVTADDGANQVSADSAATAIVTAPICPTPFALGPLAAGSMSESAGSIAWSNLTQATANDGQSASAAGLLPAARTDVLTVKGFGFAVPAWALLTGAKVDVKRSASGGAVKDLRVLISGPGHTTSNLALATTWPTTPTVATYGGPTTNYLSGWPASSINDSEFGVRLIASNTGSSIATADVDSVQITLYYTTGTAIGPNTPATMADDTTIGSLSWINPGNAAVLDSVYADSPVLTGGQTTYGLAATGYGFSLPAGKQPSGVYVEVTRKASGSFAPFIQDAGITLFKAGAPVGPGVNPGTSWSTTPTTVSYGGATSKFGTTLNATDVANAGFGFRFVATNVTSSNAGPASVDAVRMWVVYDAAATNVPNYGSAATTTALGQSWTNISAAAVEDGVSANVSGLSGNEVTNVLRSSGHGFNVPSDAWVRGVALDVRRGSLSGNLIEDSMVYLRLGGQTVLPNHALAGPWPTALTTASYGSSTDLWGQSVMQPGDVNNASLGADFVAKYSSTAGNDWVYVDGVKLTVTYCPHP